MTPSPSPTEAPLTLGVVGDSLSNGGVYDSVPTDPGSWVEYLGDDIEVSAGWRRDGATSTAMADNLPPFSADVLVMMAGTNDVLNSVPEADTVRSVVSVRAKARVSRVILCAIPPLTNNPAGASQLNSTLEELATTYGWEWVDPWADVRNGDDWDTDASVDGIHPSSAVYAEAALVIEETLRLGGSQ